VADFGETIAQAYAVEGPAVELGKGVLDGAVVAQAVVRLPLATMNRHGLIAGATGTGKTKTMQTIAEQLSAAGVPVLLCDVKGDVSGLAAPGAADGPAPKRAAELGEEFAPEAFPVEFLALGGVGPACRSGSPCRTSGRSCWRRSSRRTRRRRRRSSSSSATRTSTACRCSTWPTCARCEGVGGVATATVGVLLRTLV